MIKPPQKAKRDKNEPEIIDAFKGLNCCVEKLDTPVDLIVLFRGRQRLVEVKGPTGKLTEAQEKFLARWPVGVPIVRSADDVVRLVAQWAARRP